VVNGTDDPAILANLIYSSNWITNQTLQMKLSGGNLVVHSGFSLQTSMNNTNSITKSAQMEIQAGIVPFTVKAFPNPSGDEFNVYLEGANNESVNLILYDGLGRQLKKFEKESGNIP